MKILSIYDSVGNETRIEVERSDNVVAVKRKIRQAIYVKEVKMELYDGDMKLDNNQYLPDNIIKLEYKEIPEKAQDIIISVARNILQIPEWIQINKDNVISDLKDIIIDVSNIDKDISIFDEDGNELEDNEIIKNYDLFNDSEIKICLKVDRNLNLQVTNLLPIQSTFHIECSISDKISEVKENIIRVFGFPMEMTLFSEITILEDDKRLIDYSVQNNDLLFYIESNKENQIKIHELIKNGKFAKVYKGKNLTTGSDIVLKKYSLKWKKIRNFIPLKDELITLSKFKNDDKVEFVQLDCVFQTKTHFFIGMEYMEGGSLDARIPLNENKIIEYSKQILGALDYLHRSEIIYRNMKCSSILLDQYDNVKLCNFHLSKFLTDFKTHSIIESILGSKPADYNWTAPEVIAGDRYDAKADIWSFGATLIEMLIGKPPYWNLKPYDVRVAITKTKIIPYDNSLYPSKVVDKIIGRCLVPLPEKRPSADTLKKFIENDLNL